MTVTDAQMRIMMRERNKGRTPELVRAMHGLAVSLGAGEVCDALTGGSALLGLHAGKGQAEELEDPRLNAMLQALMEWFHETYSAPFGGIRCAEILADNPQTKSAAAKWCMASMKRCRRCSLRMGLIRIR